MRDSVGAAVVHPPALRLAWDCCTLHMLPCEQPGVALSQLWYQIIVLVQQGHCEFKSRIAKA